MVHYPEFQAVKKKKKNHCSLWSLLTMDGHCSKSAIMISCYKSEYVYLQFVTTPSESQCCIDLCKTNNSTTSLNTWTTFFFFNRVEEFQLKNPPTLNRPLSVSFQNWPDLNVSGSLLYHAGSIKLKYKF